MNLLKKTRAYLIGSMQYSDGQNWRERTEQALASSGITVFNPYKKPFLNPIAEDAEARAQLSLWMENEEYDKVAERMKQVRSDDLRLTDVSDFFIVEIKPGVASWGSAEELSWSTRQKKPIFVFVEGGKKKTPLWVMGMIPHKYIYNSLDEVLSMIQNIDAGIVKMDSTRWRLLKPEHR